MTSQIWYPSMLGISTYLFLTLGSSCNSNLDLNVYICVMMASNKMSFLKAIRGHAQCWIVTQIWDLSVRDLKKNHIYIIARGCYLTNQFQLKMTQNLIFCWSKVGVKLVFDVTEREWVRWGDKRRWLWGNFL